MDKADFERLMEKHGDKYGKFSEIGVRRSNRSDLHAFLLLDSLVPGTDDVVGASEHDIFYLGFDVAEVAKAINEDQIIELVRCGVFIESQYRSLAMFS